jgi:anthranilate phosphoribosyltransferase
MHSADGLDEFSIGAPTFVADVEGDRIREYEIDPQRLGLRHAKPGDLAPPSLEAAAELMRTLLRGEERGPARDMLLLSAAAALIAAGIVADFDEGIRVAAQSIDFGDAWTTFERLREASHGR